MTIEALKMAKLSPATAGYLAIYIKLADIFGELSDTTAKIYDDVNVDKINNACFNALTQRQERQHHRLEKNPELLITAQR